MKITSEIMNYVLGRYPQSAEDNTEFCLRVWETACESRGIKFPEELKQVIRDYLPESITRKRREYTESTKYQKEKEYKTWFEYRKA